MLDKLAMCYPEAELSKFEGRAGTELLRGFLAGWVEESRRQRKVQLSAATRSNIISVLHSFSTWAESEDLIENDPSRKIRRPPKRWPKIERPVLIELEAVRRAATLHELPAILLMEGAGLRNAEVRQCRWQDLDLVVSSFSERGAIGIGSPLTPTCSRSSAAASERSDRSSMITSSRLSLSSGLRTSTVLGVAKIRSSPHRLKLYGEWFDASASGPAYEPSRPIPFVTASQIVSCAKAGVM